ncbi:uncharacterized protein EDB91DRAFT_1310220 [Suillus paluster]|uniref:uncharacterized protein n=1 Tax=Suillus paluster TaxID=48578 RepID=UPI001B871B05|nr:uncharacterized protein EDB91DRAFT_1310220 [Suillus paluster]KAG1717716.1 hypothetical protein EDB91DRAFT_1310220 [Suillus paluster]
MTYVVEARTRCPRLCNLTDGSGDMLWHGTYPRTKLAPVSPERHPVFHLTRDRNAYECNSRAAARFQITLQYLDNVPIPAMFSIAFAKSSRDLQKSEMGKEHVATITFYGVTDSLLQIWLSRWFWEGMMLGGYLYHFLHTDTSCSDQSSTDEEEDACHSSSWIGQGQTGAERCLQALTPC